MKSTKKPNHIRWKVLCTLGYQTSLFELFINGQSSELREDLPKPLPNRIVLVKETRESLALERLDPYASTNIVVCFESEDDLEDYQPLSLYPTKTKPEVTGTPYLQAKIDILYPHGCGSGALLVYSNHLTRLLILGEELTELFEAAGAFDPLKAQQWVKDNLSQVSV